MSRGPARPYGLRVAAPGRAISCRVSIMARAAREQNGSCGRAAQMWRTGAGPRMGRAPAEPLLRRGKDGIR